MTEPDAALRERVQRLSARGVAVPLVQVLVGQPCPPDRFRKVFARELAQGTAEADAAVSEALFDLALSGKSPPVTLAWAKQRLGWSLPDDVTTAAAAASAAAQARQAREALAALCTLLDQIADDKSGGGNRADAVAEAGAACPAAPARG